VVRYTVGSPGPPRALTPMTDELARLPQGDELARLTRAIAERAAAGRRRELPEIAAAQVRSAPVPREGNQTSFGDPIAVLERGARDRAERQLLGCLLARGITLAPPAGVEAEDKVAGELLWLAAHAGIDAFPALDAALGDRSVGLWGALCDLVRRIDGGREPSFDRADALFGASVLCHAAHPDVKAAALRLGDEVEDPALARLLRGGGQGAGEAGPALVGEVEPAPRGALATALMALTGVLLLGRGVRLLARVALGRKQSAELVVTSEGVRVKTRTEMLGRVTNEAEHVMPAAGLVRATREVRFPRLAFYAGLGALLVGSFLGVSLFVDGARSASYSLLWQGALIALAGIAVELTLTTLIPGGKGRCRVVLVPRKGASVCVGGLDIDAAQRTLAQLSRR
jgi:hypothetical protein